MSKNGRYDPRELEAQADALLAAAARKEFRRRKEVGTDCRAKSSPAGKSATPPPRSRCAF